MFIPAQSEGKDNDPNLRRERYQTSQPRPFDFEFFAFLSEIATDPIQFTTVMIIHLKTVQVTREDRTESCWSNSY